MEVVVGVAVGVAVGLVVFGFRPQSQSWMGRRREEGRGEGGRGGAGTICPDGRTPLRSYDTCCSSEPLTRINVSTKCFSWTGGNVAFWT